MCWCQDAQHMGLTQVEHAQCSSTDRPLQLQRTKGRSTRSPCTHPFLCLRLSESEAGCWTLGHMVLHTKAPCSAIALDHRKAVSALQHGCVSCRSNSRPRAASSISRVGALLGSGGCISSANSSSRSVLTGGGSAH